MSPRAKQKTSLLYVSAEGANVIDVFSVPGYKLEGQIGSGIDQPEGLATDDKGDLYVANARGESVTVYKRGHTSPSLTLNDDHYPDGVAVAKNGYVFVADDDGGAVEVFPPGATSPTAMLTNSNIKEAFGIGIDSSGNVYATGWGDQYSYTPVVVKYTDGSGSGVNLNLNDMFVPAGVVVDEEGNIVETDFGRDVINIYAPGHETPSSTISAITPDRSAIDKKGKLLYVPLGTQESVEVLQYPSGSVKASFYVGGFAAGAALIPSP